MNKTVQKKTILFIEFCFIGGPPNALINLINFIQQNYPQYRCFVAGSPRSVLEQAALKYNFMFFPLSAAELLILKPRPFPIIGTYFSALTGLFKLIRQYRPSLIYANHYMWSIYANPLGFLFNLPVIIHLRDLWPLEPRFSRFLMKFNPNATYVAISRYVKTLFVGQFKLNPQKTMLIYDGVEAKIFKPATPKQIQQKQRSPQKTFIMISRVEKERNIDTFVDLAAILIPKYPSFKFVHYGYNPLSADRQYFQSLQQRTIKLGLTLGKNFQFKPYEPNPQKLSQALRRAYLSIVPAEKFALPNVAIESLMCGTPIIGLNTGGNPEVISSEAIGSLLEINSPVVYFQAIEAYLSGKKNYQKIAAKAIILTRKRFSAFQQHTKIMKLIESRLS